MLYIACGNGKDDIVATLLAANSDVDIGCDGNNTPLMVAASSGHVNIVKMLIDYNCNIFATNSDGLTAFSIAVMRRYTSIVKYIYHCLIGKVGNGKYKKDKISIDEYINQRENKNGHTPYMVACKICSPKMIKMLTTMCNVNVKLRDNQGKIGSDLIPDNGDDYDKIKNWLKTLEK